ncbi:glycosyltransferase family 2 protein [Phaeobacter piscinae]|uniref:glycosyltransferase family 2 protein n=1 Tax=Phaeobacter piscinae TaxID=1580596 RepID=UPI0039F6C11D
MTTPSKPKWGLVSTIKADAKSILDFAAYHLDLGAHRLHLYLDAENPDVYPHLKAHPKIRVITCDDRYWKQHKAPRPKMHQPRQTMNATHAYERIQTDWVAHIDVDEFLWPHVAAHDQSRAITETLAALPAETDVLRMRPLEALAGHADHYKAMVPSGAEREHEVRAIYPNSAFFSKAAFSATRQVSCLPAPASPIFSTESITCSSMVRKTPARPSRRNCRSVIATPPAGMTGKAATDSDWRAAPTGRVWVQDFRRVSAD